MHKSGKLMDFSVESCLEDYYLKKGKKLFENLDESVSVLPIPDDLSNSIINFEVLPRISEVSSEKVNEEMKSDDDEEDNILDMLRKNISSTFDSHFGMEKQEKSKTFNLRNTPSVSNKIHPRKKRGTITSTSESYKNSTLPRLSKSFTGKKRSRKQTEEPCKKKRKVNFSVGDNLLSDYISINQKKFKRLGLLGKGGSSKVLKCLSEDNEIVAVKRVHLTGPASIVKSFLNEVKILQQLQGEEHIIKLKDSEICQEKRLLYLVMECGDVDLNVLLKRRKNKPLNLNLIRVYWQQMLESVHAIHQKRIVHGDLKPANFLLVKGNLKLIDFGIAKKIQHDNTTNIVRDTQVGTLNYISPEALVENKDITENPEDPKYKVGRSSDIWSLGCILSQMTTGFAPFAQLSMVKKLHAITSDNFPITFPSNISLEIADILSRTLRRNPLKRPTIPELLRHQFLKPNSERKKEVISRRDAAILLNRNSQVLLSKSYTYSQKEIFASRMIEAVQKKDKEVGQILQMKVGDSLCKF